MTANDQLLARADAWLWGRNLSTSNFDANLINDLAAALRTTETQRDHLQTLGQGQRVIDLLERYEALKAEHDDCLTVAHQQETELERTETQRDAAYAVIRRVHWPEMDEWDWTPAEAEAIAHAIRSEP